MTSRDRKRYARARARGEAVKREPSAVVSAHFDKRRDRVDLAFQGGLSMAIPRRMIPGLENATKPNLKVIRVSPAGDALSRRSLDVDVYLPGLVERAFGNRLFATATGRPRGRKRSTPSAAAAKSGGAKGGGRRKGVRA